MGKRSSFERIEKDRYETIDPRAVEILRPILSIDSRATVYPFPSPVRFAEICVGSGVLMRELERAGNLCVYANDIDNASGFGVQKSLFEITNSELEAAEPDCIITNPPWSRPILHPLIEHCMKELYIPTWLLFDSDWAFTKQSSELLSKYCTDIVAVGRLKWIPGTSMSGKDNCSWYRFSPFFTHDGNTIFHPRKT